MSKKFLIATTATTALYVTACAAHADAKRFVFRLPSAGLLTAAAEGAGGPVQPGGDSGPGGSTGTPGGNGGGDTGTPPDGDGDQAEGGGVETPSFDGHFDVVEITFPGAGGWLFQCETGNWHVAGDRAARLALLTTYNGAPAVGTAAKNGTFTFQSDAIVFTVPKSGAPVVTAGAGLGTWLPPCYEPYPDVHGPLWRVLPITPSGQEFGAAGTPIVTTKRLF